MRVRGRSSCIVSAHTGAEGDRKTQSYCATCVVAVWLQYLSSAAGVMYEPQVGKHDVKWVGGDETAAFQLHFFEQGMANIRGRRRERIET